MSQDMQNDETSDKYSSIPSNQTPLSLENAKDIGDIKNIQVEEHQSRQQSPIHILQDQKSFETRSAVRKSRSSEKYKPKIKETIEFEQFNDNESEERIYADEGDQFIDEEEVAKIVETQDYKVVDQNNNQQMFNNITNNSTLDNDGNRSHGPVSGGEQFKNIDPSLSYQGVEVAQIQNFNPNQKRIKSAFNVQSNNQTISTYGQRKKKPLLSPMINQQSMKFGTIQHGKAMSINNKKRYNLRQSQSKAVSKNTLDYANSQKGRLYSAIQYGQKKPGKQMITSKFSAPQKSAFSQKTISHHNIQSSSNQQIVANFTQVQPAAMTLNRESSKYNNSNPHDHQFVELPITKMTKKEQRKQQKFNECVYVNPNFDYKKDKFLYNLKYNGL